MCVLTVHVKKNTRLFWKLSWETEEEETTQSLQAGHRVQPNAALNLSSLTSETFEESIHREWFCGSILVCKLKKVFKKKTHCILSSYKVKGTKWKKTTKTTSSERSFSKSGKTESLCFPSVDEQQRPMALFYERNDQVELVHPSCLTSASVWWYLA